MNHGSSCRRAIEAELALLVYSVRAASEPETLLSPVTRCSPAINTSSPPKPQPHFTTSTTPCSFLYILLLGSSNIPWRFLYDIHTTATQWTNSRNQERTMISSRMNSNPSQNLQPQSTSQNMLLLSHSKAT